MQQHLHAGPIRYLSYFPNNFLNIKNRVGGGLRRRPPTPPGILGRNKAVSINLIEPSSLSIKIVILVGKTIWDSWLDRLQLSLTSATIPEST